MKRLYRYIYIYDSINIYNYLVYKFDRLSIYKIVKEIWDKPKTHLWSDASSQEVKDDQLVYKYKLIAMQPTNSLPKCFLALANQPQQNP